MGSQGKHLAAAVSAALDDVVAFVRTCDDATWHATNTAEGWPVGVVARHAACGHNNVTEWLDTALQGGAITITADELDALNARDARAWSGTDRAVVLAELAAHRTTIERIAALSDDELDSTASFGPAGGRALPVAQICGAAERHLRGHLASMQSARGARSA
jgi:hypothetical protein